MTNISITNVNTESDFAALKEEWDRLFSRAVDTNPFLSHDWLFSWWVSYRPKAKLLVLLARDESNDLIGIAPLMLERKFLFGIPMRVLRFVGDGTWETDHMNFIVDESHSQAVLAAFHRGLKDIGWDLLELNQLPEASLLTDGLLKLARVGWSVSAEPVPCPVARLTGEVDDVMRRLPARMRSSLRASVRRLSKEYKVRFGTHDDEDEIDGALAALYRNHASRWQAKGQDGVFADRRKQAFYGRVSRKFLERGWLRFFYLALDDRIIAQQFCFEFGNRVLLLQEGFDFAYAKDNVGNVLRLMVFEELTRQGGKTYDFLAGTSRHKAAWSTATEFDLRVRCANRTARGRLYILAKSLFRRFKWGRGSPELEDRAGAPAQEASA
jgi:CelD/BcsL family acetyltransferase involved in cellulose biosynthesis